MKLIQQDNSEGNEVSTIESTQRDKTKGDANLSRGEEVISKLRTDHLNGEEKRALQEICFDYQVCFIRPGIS
jgi:hypothetical protein